MNVELWNGVFRVQMYLASVLTSEGEDKGCCIVHGGFSGGGIKAVCVNVELWCGVFHVQMYLASVLTAVSVRGKVKAVV